MFTEDELLPVSALQHLVFCGRQCALIHLEREWAENVQTLEGSRLHKRTDESGPRVERRGEVVILRGLTLRSSSLGLFGRSDIVELHRREVEGGGAVVPGFDGEWELMPVEYKRGKPKQDGSDETQLCAQALCLEEMFETEIGKGYLFYGKRRRRHEVFFERTLREQTKGSVERLREIVDSRVTPPAEHGPKCESCSLLEICVPTVSDGEHGSAVEYLNTNVRRILADGRKE